MASGTLTVRILGDDDGFKNTVKNMDGHMSRLGDGFKRLGVAAAAVGTAFAGGALAFGKSAVDAAGEAMKVNAQTESVIKSMGGAAGVTAEYVADLSHNLQGLSGVQDETIQTGANMLLTFGNIQDKAGEGNDIFTQATKTMLDMSVAMGSDAQTAAMQLGKALNNPAEGLSALRRVGIQFTEQQQDQIKMMQASGDMAGAQGVMLAELQRQFGGSAEAAGAAMTPFERLKLRFGDLQEEVGMRLIPVIERIADWLGNVLPPIIEPVAGFIGNLVNQVKNLWEMFASGEADASGFGEIMDSIFGNTGALIPLFMDLYKVGETVVGFIRDHFQPILIGLGVTIGLLAAPWLTVIGALVYAYTQFEWFRDGVSAVVGFIQGRFEAFSEWWSEMWPQIREVIGHFVAVVQDLWKRFGDRIMNVLKIAVDTIKGVFQGVFTAIKGVVELVVALINGDWSRAWDAALKIVDGLGTAIRSALFGIAKIIGEAILAIVPAIANLGARMGGALMGALGDLGYKVYVWFYELPGKIGGWLGNLGSILVAPFKEGFNAIARLWNSTIGSFSFTAPSWIPGFGGRGFDVPDMPYFHTGGIFDSGRGEGPAMLRDGEGIFTPAQMRAIGSRQGMSVTIELVVAPNAQVVDRRAMEWLVGEAMPEIRRQVTDLTRNGSSFSG